MRKGHGLSRQRLVAFATVLVLALAVPGMAFAASFSSAKPAAGSSTTVTKPTMSVIVYDKYQVYGSGSRYMYLDGRSVSFKYAAVSGWGWKKQKFTYTPASALTLGTHTVSIKVKNRRGTTYRYSWKFTVADGVAPVTSFNSATNGLSASDNVGVAHTYYRLDGGAPVEGAVVNATVGSHLLEYWSMDAAGNEEMHKYALVVVAAPKVDPHTFPTDVANAACQGAGCHTPSKYRNNVARLHEETSRTCRCHQNDTATPVTKSCVACHGTAPQGHSAATHVAIASAVAATDAASCNFSGCHGANSVVTIHRGNCALCHDSADATVKAVIAAGNATCESCHDQGSFDAIHGPSAAATSAVHMATIPGTCTATCHPTSAVASHTGFGTGRPGCTACHFRTDRAPSVACADCHSSAQMGAAHEFQHTALQTRMGTSLEGKTCTACHGTSILPVGFVATEHNGCSCHVYNEASTSVNGCADCHEGAYAPHGFTNGTTSYGTGYLSVSGHNTELFGKVGAFTDYSGLGIKDTADETATMPAPLTVNNTFKAGFDWDSVITCEDCHAGLVGKEVAGPHGANTVENWGIDPAYSGEFGTATLWGGKYTQGASTMADATTFTVGPFAEGIAQWTPAGGDSEELTDYQVIQPDMSTPASTKFAAGTASVSAGNVICVKCHDLYDASKNTGFKGWGNYAHEHHSADTGSFKMYFGKYNVYNITGTSALTGTLVSTVVAENGTSAIAEASASNSDAVALYYKVYSGTDGKTGLLGDFYYRGGDSAAALTEATTTVPAYAAAKSITVQTVIAPGLGREVAGQCRNCHIAVPHGWKRPKLIVYSNMDSNSAFRVAKGLPAVGDSLPYNIGPAVYEGEGLAGTNIGSGQMNGLASKPIPFKEAQKDINGNWVTAATPLADLVIENEELPALIEINKNPANGFTGDEYVNWSSAQCNACGHHSSTSFATGAPAGALSWSSRENVWSSTGASFGAWK